MQAAARYRWNALVGRPGHMDAIFQGTIEGGRPATLPGGMCECLVVRVTTPSLWPGKCVRACCLSLASGGISLKREPV